MNGNENDVFSPKCLYVDFVKYTKNDTYIA